MSLYHKYRPPTLEDIRGNSDMIPILQEMLSDKTKCTHAFLLYGPTGCGKTTIGRIIAKDFRENSQFKPLEGSCRVWLIDECHKLTNDAQNALLKILEDTPQHVYFILCTTEPQRLLGTIKGRCSQFQVKPLNERQMFGLLRSVVKAENESMVKTVYEQIAQDSFGHPRNALQILDQVLRVDVEQRLEVAQRSAEEQSQSIELCRALVAGGAWKEVRVILNGLKDQEPESIRRHVLGYAQGVLLKGDNIRAGLVLEEFVEPFWNSGYPGLVHACYAAIKN